jgi:hypothetical protein
MLGMRSVVGACAGFFFMNAAVVIASNYYPYDSTIPMAQLQPGDVPFPAGVFALPLLAFVCMIVMIVKLPNEGVVYAAENASADEAKATKPALASFIYVAIAIVLVGVAVAIVYFVYQAVSNLGTSVPDEGISFAMSAAIAIIFLVFAITFIIMMFKVAANKKSNEGISTKIKSNTWVFILANILIIGSTNCMMSNVAQVVGGHMIGLPLPDSIKELGPQNIPNVMNSFTIAMLISGFIFKPVWIGLFKRHAYTVGIAMCGIGLLLLYVSVVMMGSVPFAVIAAFIFGLGFQTYNGAVILRIAQSNDNKHVALSTSYLMAFNGVGQTFGPIWIPGLIMLVFGMSFSDPLIFSLSWLFGGILLIVMCILMGIYTQKEKVYRPDAAF